MPTHILKNGPLFPSNKQIASKLEKINFLLPDGITKLTGFPIYDVSEVPESLVHYMHEQFNIEIENGKTYPQYEKMTFEEYKNYWFQSFCCIVLSFDILSTDITESNNIDWKEHFFGTFYIKPNYAGRCSHNCNAGFFIPENKRGNKLGKKLGQLYLKFAPHLGYTYSVFNLVFVSNPASWKIWDSLKFDRIGYIPEVAILGKEQQPKPSLNSSSNDECNITEDYIKTDAIMFGKDLSNIDVSLFDDFKAF